MSKSSNKFHSTDKNGLNNKEKNNAIKNQAIVSAAFQDHITKQLQLNDFLKLNLSNNNLNINNKVNKIVAKSKVDSGLKKVNNNVKKSFLEEEREFVLTKPNPADAPTLAEKIGLVPVDDSRIQLDENEWSKIKEKYKKREEYKEPCVICKEALGTQQQVLLSCSHTFHRNCLEVFEKFSGKKCCPMCRKEKYKARVVFDASKHYKHLCAARIQGAWRGYLVRKWYKNYRRLVPPKNPILRKKFFEEKLSDITNRIVLSFNFETDKLLNDIDTNLKMYRETMKNFDERFKTISDEEWSELFNKAVCRNHEECSICMNKYDIPKDYFAHKKLPPFKREKLKELNEYKNKPVVLLSCSHLFHSVCLNTFEELNFDKVSVCPECRSVYKKLELTLD